jgi:Transposase
VIFVGDDWAEAHHDVCVLDEHGERLAKRRVPEGLAGVRQLHALLAEHASEPGEVVIGIETDRGLWVAALLEAGYAVYAINPLAASRYRDRHAVSSAKSDPGDALMLADLVRTDRHQHRPAAADSTLAEAVKGLTRAHQSLAQGVVSRHHGSLQRPRVCRASRLGRGRRRVGQLRKRGAAGNGELLRMPHPERRRAERGAHEPGANDYDEPRRRVRLRAAASKGGRGIWVDLPEMPRKHARCVPEPRGATSSTACKPQGRPRSGASSFRLADGSGELALA